jgi:hypothetical protein
LVSSFLEKTFLLKLFHCISLSLFHLFPFLFYSICVFYFFFRLCFYFFYSYFVYLHFFYFYVFIYLFSIFYFLFQKDSSFFNMFYNENIYFLNCIFVWLDADPPVFPKDFFNRNGTSRGPSQQLPWPPCLAPALPYLSPAPQGTGSDWKNLPSTAHTDKQTPLLL